MGIADFFKKQFIDIIEWTDAEPEALAFPFPMPDQQIQSGATLVVRPGQAAVFVDEGQIADVFGPGTRKLTTKTLPLLSDLKHWETGFESPFKSDVVFVSTALRTARPWGTPSPVAVEDPQFGPIRLRSFGTYAWRVDQPQALCSSLAAASRSIAASEVEAWIESRIAASVANAFGRLGSTFSKISASQNDLAQALGDELTHACSAIGVRIDAVVVESVSLPEELQQSLDGRARTAMLGGSAAFAAFQSADSLPAAAANPGGVAALGAQAAMGAAIAAGVSQGAAPPAKSSDPLSDIARLATLRDSGALTEAEFAAKKAELLARL